MDTGSLMIALNRLSKGDVGRVTGFVGDDKLVAKLREIGFAEGDEVELLAVGWLGGAPLSFRLNRTVFALRKAEAALVLVGLHAGRRRPFAFRLLAVLTAARPRPAAASSEVSPRRRTMRAPLSKHAPAASRRRVGQKSIL